MKAAAFIFGMTAAGTVVGILIGLMIERFVVDVFRNRGCMANIRKLSIP